MVDEKSNREVLLQNKITMSFQYHISVGRVTAGFGDFLRLTKFLPLIIKINAKDNNWDN